MAGAPLSLIPVQLMQEHSLVRSLGSTEGLQKLLTEVLRPRCRQHLGPDGDS